MRFYWLVLTSAFQHGKSPWRCAQRHKHIWQCWKFDLRHWLLGQYPYDTRVVKLTWAQIGYLLYTEIVLLALLFYLLFAR